MVDRPGFVAFRNVPSRVERNFGIQARQVCERLALGALRLTAPSDSPSCPSATAFATRPEAFGRGGRGNEWNNKSP